MDPKDVSNLLREGAILADKALNTPPFEERLKRLAQDAVIWQGSEHPVTIPTEDGGHITMTGFNECCVCWGQDEHDDRCPVAAILAWLGRGSPRSSESVS